MKSDKIDKTDIIARGISVSPGQAVGAVKIVKNSADVKKVKQGDIMVVSRSSPAFAIGVMNSSGLICEGGGVLTHICIVAREMGIPCIAKVDNATVQLKENMTIKLDAAEGIVYEYQ